MHLELSGPAGHARLPLPADWNVLPDPAPGTAVAVEPASSADDGFATNLVLSADDNTGLSFRDWQVATDELLPRMLTDYLLLDLERCDVAGQPGGRRLAHHVTPDGAAVTMEQWFTSVSGVGWTLTATVDSFRYDELADLLTRSAADLMIVEGDLG
jgi:hypothetical protein